MIKARTPNGEAMHGMFVAGGDPMRTAQSLEQRATEASIELRPYQRDALTAIEAAALRGVRRQVVSLPTGAGKTVIFTHLLVERQIPDADSGA